MKKYVLENTFLKCGLDFSSHKKLVYTFSFYISDLYCSDSFEITDKYFSVLRNSVATESIEEPISENITAGTYFVDSYVLGGKKMPKQF